jgi:pimeloyl-ACP methyl ester carboxylesterase
MRLKKRYLALLLPIGMVGILQTEFFAFRMDEATQRQELEEKTGIEPSFYTYQEGEQTIHYTHLGEEGKPLVVLVHGAPGSSSAFMNYLADTTLIKRAQIVAVDRPGYGFSDYGRTEPSLERQAGVLRPILERHRAPEVILLGHSYGGPIIVKMAAMYPEWVDGLVMVAGSVDPELEPREWWRGPLDWRAVRWMLPGSMRVCNQEILPLYQELKAMEADWAKITCPVTIIQGENDKLVPKGNADYAGKMLINSSMVNMCVIEDASHFILWSMQDYVVKQIAELIVYTK